MCMSVKFWMTFHPYYIKVKFRYFYMTALKNKNKKYFIFLTKRPILYKVMVLPQKIPTIRYPHFFWWTCVDINLFRFKKYLYLYFYLYLWDLGNSKKLYGGSRNGHKDSNRVSKTTESRIGVSIIQRIVMGRCHFFSFPILI